MTDADRLLDAARRPLVLGIGGGGDVVGALATAEACRLRGAAPVVGGVSWERRPIDPRPGPRAAAEIESARELAPAVLAASGATRVRESGVLFAESRMAALLGEECVLVDATLGPAAIADGIEAAAAGLGCDLLVFLDVGGDALAHGDEPGLASPLCDAVLMAAAARLAARAQPPVLAAIFGIGCDGELTTAEVLERIAEVAAAGGLAGARGLTPAVVARLDEARGRRAHRGERAGTPLLPRRDGQHHHPARAAHRRAVASSGRSPSSSSREAALGSAARLAAAVGDARDLDHANELLHALRRANGARLRT